MLDQDLAHVYGRMNGAMWFGAAEKLLGGHDGKSSYLSLPGYFLACHAFEVLLKAALLKAGFTEGNLRKDFGHSIIKLVEKLIVSGFQIDGEVHHLLRILSISHENHVVRYSLLEPGQTYPLLPWTQLQKIFDELVMLTHSSRFPIGLDRKESKE
jgi:hypothetical protein